MIAHPFFFAAADNIAIQDEYDLTKSLIFIK